MRKVEDIKITKSKEQIMRDVAAAMNSGVPYSEFAYDRKDEEQLEREFAQKHAVLVGKNGNGKKARS